jgi:hypothetical protein
MNLRIKRIAGVAAAAVLASAAVAVASPSMAVNMDEVTFEQLVQPFLGGTSVPPLSAADLAELDSLNQFNRRYDLGDLRLILYNNPELIPENIVVLP